MPTLTRQLPMHLTVTVGSVVRFLNICIVSYDDIVQLKPMFTHKGYGDRHTILGINTREHTTIVPDTRAVAADNSSVDGVGRRNLVYHLKREWPLEPPSTHTSPEPPTPPRRLGVSDHRPTILSGPSTNSAIRTFSFGNSAVKVDSCKLSPFCHLPRCFNKQDCILCLFKATFSTVRQMPVTGCTPTKIPRILARGQNVSIRSAYILIYAPVYVHASCYYPARFATFTRLHADDLCALESTRIISLLG